MRQGFVHTAVLVVDEASEPAAGAAITVALCGHWEHEPPCPLAPHHTTTTRRGDEVDLRVVFSAEPEREAEVRALIEAALTAERLDLVEPVATWHLRSAERGELTPAEAARARDLTTA